MFNLALHGEINGKEIILKPKDKIFISVSDETGYIDNYMGNYITHKDDSLLMKVDKEEMWIKFADVEDIILR